jgi:predicted transcriptional regulator
MGRPVAVSRETAKAAQELVERGHMVAHVARMLKVSRPALYRALSRLEETPSA